MLDYRRLINSETLGTDQVLDGGNVRDRFLTAFILQNGGVLVSAESFETPESPMDAQIFFDVEAAGLATGESEPEPLFIHVIDPWSTGSGDEES
jgi:hypothetical protein